MNDAPVLLPVRCPYCNRVIATAEAGHKVGARCSGCRTWREGQAG